MGKNNKGGNKQPVNKTEEAPDQEEKQVEPEEKIITA